MTDTPKLSSDEYLELRRVLAALRLACDEIHNPGAARFRDRDVLQELDAAEAVVVKKLGIAVRISDDELLRQLNAP